MRINKYISNCGFCSRRKADLLIESNKVTVNGEIATKGVDVSETDIVKIDGKLIKIKDKRKYFLLNKPIGYVTTLEDKFAKKIVMDLFDVQERIYPVGRLDKDSFGLLIFTNDGDLAFKLTHPKHSVEKQYIVKVDKNVIKSDLEKLSKGLFIDGIKTRKAKFEYFKDSKTIKVFLKEGRNRQIRKMFKKLGYEVTSLERIAFGNIKLGNLEIGKYRELSKDEINYLKSI